jgi:hypothetical protein
MTSHLPVYLIPMFYIWFMVTLLLIFRNSEFVDDLFASDAKGKIGFAIILPILSLIPAVNVIVSVLGTVILCFVSFISLTTNKYKTEWDAFCIKAQKIFTKQK